MRVLQVLLLLATISCSPKTFAQEELPRPQELTIPKVKIDLGPQVELQVLIDYVSKRFGIGILFGDEVVGQQVTLNAPNEVPVDSLLPLLQTVLKMKGFALVDMELPGWKRVVAADELTSTVPMSANSDTLARSSTAPITKVFRLGHIDSAYASELVAPFLSSSTPVARSTGARSATRPSGGSVSSLSQQIAGAQSRAAAGSDGVRVLAPQRDILIVTDFAFNIRKVAKLLAKLDVPPREVISASVTVKHQSLAKLKEQLEQLTKSEIATDASEIQVVTNEPQNQMLLRGTKNGVQQAAALIRKLDAKPTTSTETYTLKYYSASGLKELLDQINVGELTAAADSQTNRLFVHTNARTHDRIRQIIDLVDNQPTRAQRRLQYYKLENLTATELLSTLRALQDGGNVNQDISATDEI